ncbi:Uncharacterized protein HDE_12078 [Halotydeus destructor]|nr:Uncharacterized protein HDE_12078 [Halotydeus destructor]
MSLSRLSHASARYLKWGNNYVSTQQGKLIPKKISLEAFSCQQAETSRRTLSACFLQIRNFNTEKDSQPVKEGIKSKDDPIIKAEFKEDSEPNAGQKLKLLIRDYGPTVMVVHISLSLCSLGMFYVLIDQGIGLESLISSIKITDSMEAGTVATAGTFVVAYAVHKACAPVRIGMTALITPVFVRFLRKKGILKPHVIKRDVK